MGILEIIEASQGIVGETRGCSVNEVGAPGVLNDLLEGAFQLCLWVRPSLCGPSLVSAPHSVAFFLCLDVSLLLRPPDGECPSLVHFFSVFLMCPSLCHLQSVCAPCPVIFLPVHRTRRAPTPRISQRWLSQPCQQIRCRWCPKCSAHDQQCSPSFIRADARGFDLPRIRAGVHKLCHQD